MRYHQSVLILLLNSMNLVSYVRNETTTADPELDYEIDQLERTPEEIETALKKYKIIPELLDWAPNETIYLEWMNGPRAELGNEITAIHEIERRPKWINYKNVHDKLHIILMIGLDEPSAQNRSSSLFLYWLVSNLPGHDVPETDYVLAERIVEYRAPRPLRGTGLHRYVFLVYEQGNKTIHTKEEVDSKDVTERLQFNLKDFVEEYDLGELYAVNFFVAQWQKPPYDYSTDDRNQYELTTLTV